MKVNELCKNYKAAATEAAKNDYLKKSIKTRKYIPYAEKVTHAKALVAASNMTDAGDVVLDSPRQYLSNVYAILNMYTDLELNEDAWVEEYDQLNELGLVKKIIDQLPEADLGEFEVLRNMVYDDFIENQTSTRSWISKLVQKFSEKLNSGMEKLAETLNGIDLEEIKKKIS